MITDGGGWKVFQGHLNGSVGLDGYPTKMALEIWAASSGLETAILTVWQPLMMSCSELILKILKGISNILKTRPLEWQTRQKSSDFWLEDTIMVPRGSNFSFISNKLVGSLPFHPHNFAKHWQKITVVERDETSICYSAQPVTRWMFTDIVTFDCAVIAFRFWNFSSRNCTGGVLQAERMVVALEVTSIEML